MQTFSVHEITRYIHDLFDADDMLADVWVRGEVSNLTKARSGHWYFTIKDATAQLRCVMFRGAARTVRADVDTGDEILVHGRVSVYDARGEYQLYADQIEAVGSLGDLHVQFEALKAKLDTEGLFDPARKRPIPTFPKRIGIVTSPGAAAWHDMQNVLRRRFPIVELILSPTLVQGAEAPPQIVAALEKLNRRSDVDVIIIARGGGSLEDLWCFNDETVARAVAASRVPVISGIGHEIDFTIVDFVADLRAPTPSAAAELATPNRGRFTAGFGSPAGGRDRGRQQRAGRSRARSKPAAKRAAFCVAVENGGAGSAWCQRAERTTGASGAIPCRTIARAPGKYCQGDGKGQPPAHLVARLRAGARRERHGHPGGGAGQQESAIERTISRR